MTSPLDQIRATTLMLPETEARDTDGGSTFFVGGTPFAQVREDGDGDGRVVIRVRTADADEQTMLIEADPALYARPADADASDWVSMTVAADVDWTLVEDRIARSWELAAPQRLLEVGGR